MAYATSVPAIFVLSLAAAGFFSCLCQIILRAVEKEVPALASQVGGFAGDVVVALERASDEWANQANGVVKGINDDINKDVLIYVSNATDAVNKTLNVFLDSMEKGLETVFNGTMLLDPIKAVVHCVIGIKVESVQKGLTWVHDHAHVSLPLFDNDIFSVGANRSVAGDSDLHTFLASPSSVTTDEVTGAVQHVTDWLHGNLVQEALISTGLLLVYVIVVLLGVTWTVCRMAGPDPTQAVGSVCYGGDDDDGPPRSRRSGLPPWNDGPLPRPEDAHGAVCAARDEKTMAAGGRGRPGA